MTGAIAHVGPNLPQDLLRATGRHAGPVMYQPPPPPPPLYAPPVMRKG